MWWEDVPSHFKNCDSSDYKEKLKELDEFVMSSSWNHYVVRATAPFIFKCFFKAESGER